MEYRDIALQLTLKAMDKNYITCRNTKDGAFSVTAENAKQIADFYNSVYDIISKNESTVSDY